MSLQYSSYETKAQVQQPSYPDSNTLRTDDVDASEER